jgi:hypothetical protein
MAVHLVASCPLAGVLDRLDAGLAQLSNEARRQIGVVESLVCVVVFHGKYVTRFSSN